MATPTTIFKILGSRNHGLLLLMSLVGGVGGGGGGGVRISSTSSSSIFFLYPGTGISLIVLLGGVMSLIDLRTIN